MLSKGLENNLNFAFINQLYKKLTLSSKFRVLIKYDYKVCISGSDNTRCSVIVLRNTSNRLPYIDYQAFFALQKCL